MKFLTVVCILLCNCCLGQQWQAEIGGGISGYNGDLSKSAVNFKTIGPSITAAIKYMMPNNFIVLRAGISYGKIHANDADGKSSYAPRNLNFQSNIIEGSLVAEINLADPTVYDGLPYLFAGVGVFHFNPYTYDNNNNKVYLQPLGTEGQGTSEYPNRAMYKLTKMCIPFGLGWKYKVSDRIDIAYELGFRYTNTDYLDDVSSTYANPQILLADRGPLAVELAYRQKSPSSAPTGRIRGNPDAKDWYYMTGFKVCYKFGELFDDYQ